MGVKPNANTWTVKEQIIEDPVSGLSFQFSIGRDGLMRFSLYGDFPYGNREFIFGADGIEAGSGTALTGLCKPSWLTPLD